ncbi:MAG TPA: LacI family DNA-binding transcriptional regulator [Acidimicrobiales bacterium]|nr:LacI family DNA-binding transcriptional regulator [Acidimicrobiales bacterium]
MATRVTIAEIAKAAGVSAPTVSKVLNGRHDVGPATRARVQAVIVEQNYRRRPLLTPGQPPIVDLVFDELESPWAVEIVRGAVAAAQESGLSVALTSLSEGSERYSWFDHVTSRGTRGVILLLSRLSPRQKAELRSRRLAFAVVDPRGQPDPDVPTVGATNWAGGLAATRHLIELGHRRIGVIGGRPNLLCSRARMDGYRSAFEAAGLLLDPQVVRWGDFHVDGGFKQAMSLLESPEPPTAIFCGSDLQALGALEAARQHHLRVPVDLSLVGFDDLPLSRWTSPPLTTVRQPLADMAATAVRLVLAQDSEEPDANRSVELATSLVVRESTSVPRT